MSNTWDVIDLQYFDDGYIVEGYIGDTSPRFDARQTVISQYANSPTILRLVDLANEWFDQTGSFTQFYRSIWDITSARGFGLDVWGRIVDVPRGISLVSPNEYLGFEESGDDQPFDQAPFYNGPISTDVFNLSDDAYRVLILAKAMANISRMTAPAINQIMRALFADRGRAYVADLGNMQMQFVFDFVLTPVERALLLSRRAIPRPAGVSVSIVAIGDSPVFGFNEAGSYAQPFDVGTFYSA